MKKYKIRKKCTKCDGSGYVVIFSMVNTAEFDCTYCNGTGKEEEIIEVEEINE